MNKYLFRSILIITNLFIHCAFFTSTCFAMNNIAVIDFNDIVTSSVQSDALRKVYKGLLEELKEKDSSYKNRIERAKNDIEYINESTMESAKYDKKAQAFIEENREKQIKFKSLLNEYKTFQQSTSLAIKRFQNEANNILVLKIVEVVTNISNKSEYSVVVDNKTGLILYPESQFSKKIEMSELSNNNIIDINEQVKDDFNQLVLEDSFLDIADACLP